MVNYSVEKDKDSAEVTVLLITANVMVIGLVVGRYLLSLFKSLSGVYRNPQCNWECCLRVILSAPDPGKSLKGTADDMDGQYVRRNEIQRNKITVSNMGNVDVTGISHLGIDNDAEDDMKTGEMHRVPRNMEILSVTSSGYDENESPWEFPTSFTTDSPRGIAADSTTEVSEEFKKEAVCPVDIEGPEGGVKSLETLRVNPCKIHGAKFGASDREATADHPTAARNLALDDGDAGKRKEAVLITELNPNGAEDNTKNFAFHNQALVTDEVEETIF